MLRKVVNAKHLVPIPTGGRSVVLRESKAKMQVGVTDVPSCSTIVRLGRLQHLGGIEDGRWKRICDYVVVVSDEEESWVVLIEMKKTLAGVGKAKEQLRRSIPVVKYLQSLCEIESEKPIHVVMRYAVLVEKKNGRFDKERTRVTTGVHSETEIYKGHHVETIVGEAVAAKQLVGGC